MTIKKTIGYILIVFTLSLLSLMEISNVWKIGACAEITRYDIANPNQSIEEYTQHSILFDELCDPVENIVAFIIGILIIGFGVYLIRKRKH